ncbi:MAG: RNA polymerase sigma-54 factor, partial [Oscillospiraceae bacterium]
IKDKYLRCSWGVFELRYFFSNTLDCPDGFDACNARSLIEGLISGEPKAHPYSDQKIAQELTAGGLAISRRTVTKYREAAGIGNSSCRKSFEHH